MAKKAPVKRSVKTKTTGKKKTVKKKIPEKSIKKKLFIFLLKSGIVLLLLAALFFLIVFWGFTGPVPSRGQLEKIKNPVASEVYSEDGKLLGRYYIENRSNVSFDEISRNVINALIATEDARFYEHKGIDEVALARVFFKSILLQNRRSGGGSTLSQQVAKNLYPRKNFSIFTMPVNKLREAIIAYRLEKVYTKKEILAFYLNTVPFAENTFGIEIAAERFFSKKPLNLKVNEAAVLVGMLKANHSYNPRLFPERSLKRRNLVIDQMVRYSYITHAEGEFFKKEPLGLRYRVISYNQGPATYFVEKLRPKLLKWCEENKKSDDTPYNLYTDGLKIRTTLNYKLQRYAELSLSEHMKSLQKAFDYTYRSRNPWGNKARVLNRAMKRTDRYKTMTQARKTKEQIKEAFGKSKPTALFTWGGIKQKNVTPLDSLKHYLGLLNAGFLALEPNTGEVKAYIGGIDFRFFKYDHVTSRRQVGSTFKPLVYLAALEDGIKPNTYFANAKKVYEDYDDWSPENSHGGYGGYYSMEGALCESVNTIAVEALMETGFSDVVDVAHDLGITSNLPKFPSLALGVASCSLTEMVVAYSALINGGKRIEPYYLVSIEDAYGNVLEEFENIQDDEQAVSEENCRVITHMLKSVVKEGTGAAITNTYGITSEFAGKTGTTQDNSDGWFIGMTPNLVAGAWVGGEDPAIHFRSGAAMALPIVGKFYYKTYRDKEFAGWKTFQFNRPNEETLAMMDVPHYKEVMEVERKVFDFAKIFGKKDKKIKEQPRKAPRKPTDRKDKKPVWEKIKDILRKKEKTN